jgi:SRR1
LQALSLNRCSGGSEDHDGNAHQLGSVLCLGLGSPSSSQNANAQLAFLLEIAHSLNLVRGSLIGMFFVASHPHCQRNSRFLLSQLGDLEILRI